MSETTPESPNRNAYLPGSNVLVFSNDKGFIDHHRSILLSIGFVPITATTLDAALTVLRIMVIELVIVDEQAGTYETLRALKQGGDGGESVPVLFVSQSSDAASQCQAPDLGSAGYLDRPAFQDDVVRVLLAHCNRGGNPLWGPQKN